MRDLIVGGDLEILADVLRQIRAKEMELSEMILKKEEKPAKHESAKNPALEKPISTVNLNSINTNKSSSEVRNCLEFLIMTISKVFKLIPKQAAGLLSDENRYVTHILVKGFKGEVKPVVAWLKELIAHVETIAKLIKAEEKTNVVEMMLSTFKGGLYSKHIEIVKLAGDLYCRLFAAFWPLQVLDQAWNWYISSHGGLDGTIYLIQNHREMLELGFELLTSVGKGNLIELFTKHFRNLIEDPVQYWDLILLFAQILSSKMDKCDEKENKELKELLKYWIESACLQIEDKAKASMKTISVTFLGEVWQLFPNVVEETPEAAHGVMRAFHRCVLSKCAALQVFALSVLCGLLQFFAAHRIAHAPAVYKTLVSVLVEGEVSSSVREFVIANVKAQLVACSSMPVEVIMDPLVKQMKDTEVFSAVYNLADIEFFNVIVDNMKGNVRSGIELLDAFAKSMFNDSLFMEQTKTLFVKVLGKFASHSQVQEFAKTFVKVALSTLYSVVQANHRQRNSLQPKIKENPVSSMKEKIIIELLQIMQVLLRGNIESEMKVQSLLIYSRLRQLHRINYLPLKEVLSLYGDAEELLAGYEEKCRVVRNRSLAEDAANHLRRKSLKKDADECKLEGNKSAIQDKKQLVLYNKHRADLNRKVLQHLAKIKENRINKELQVKCTD